MNKEINTISGLAEYIDGKWIFTPNENGEGISWQNFTDRNPYDCAIIRHESKYGLFYISDMSPTYMENSNPSLISFDKEDPFPYDEVVIKGVPCHEIMIIGYRIGDNWGLDNISVDIQNRTLCRFCLISCSCPSLHEAEERCFLWRKPFNL